MDLDIAGLDFTSYLEWPFTDIEAKGPILEVDLGNPISANFLNYHISPNLANLRFKFWSQGLLHWATQSSCET